MTRLCSVLTKISLYPKLRTIWCVLLGSFIFANGVIRVASHPAHHLYRAPGQNIQPFKCSGKGSSGNGVCMFALDCNKAKGTHLGTCVDRFFFGSCCRLPDNVKFETLYKTSTVPNTVLSNEIIPVIHSTTASTRRPITLQPNVTTANEDNSVGGPTSFTTGSGSGVLPTTVRVVLKPSSSTQKLSGAHTTQKPEPVTGVVPTKPVSLTTTKVSIINKDASSSSIPTTVQATSTTTDSTYDLPSSTLSNDAVSTTGEDALVMLSTVTLDEDYVSSTLGQNQDRHNTTTSTPLVTSSTTTTSEPTTVTELSTTTVETFDPSKIGEMDYTQACGRQLAKEQPTARIVNGQKAEFGEWPWQISLRQWKRTTFMHKCGAALLNENWAITAAHCVDRVPPEDLLLRIGEYDLSSNNEHLSHVERRVQITTTHPDFNSRTFENDLALLRFYEPVTFQENIIPICLPPDDDDFVNKTGFVTGWGRLYVDGPLPNILQEVQVPVITNVACEQEYRRAGFLESIPNIFLCAGYPEGERDSCEGDSGGPLVIKQDNDRWVLAGIISWGIGCAEPHQPGVYTRISQFRDWITPILVF